MCHGVKVNDNQLHNCTAAGAGSEGEGAAAGAGDAAPGRHQDPHPGPQQRDLRRVRLALTLAALTGGLDAG